MQTAKKYFVLMSMKTHQILDRMFRITANNNDRISSSGRTRITASSEY